MFSKLIRKMMMKLGQTKEYGTTEIKA